MYSKQLKSTKNSYHDLIDVEVWRNEGGNFHMNRLRNYLEEDVEILPTRIKKARKRSKWQYFIQQQ
jgi:hypothetical protein